MNILLDLAPYLKRAEFNLRVAVRVALPNSFYIPRVPNAGLGKTGSRVFEAGLGPGGCGHDRVPEAPGRRAVDTRKAVQT